MRRMVAGAVVLTAGLAQAQELPSDLVPDGLAAKGGAVEAEMGSLITDGNDRRMRELTRTPTWLWGTARAFVPLQSDRLWGQLRLEATTMGTGFLALDGTLSDSSHLVIRLSRYRFPLASVTRVAGAPLVEDATALGNLEQTYESAEVRYDRRAGKLGGRLQIDADFQRVAGTRPLLAAGSVSDSPFAYAFGNSAYRHADDLTGGATIGYSVAPGRMRLQIAGSARLDRLDDRMTIRDRSGDQAAGLTELHDHGRVRTLELVASAASDQPAPLIGGLSYRVTHTANAPRVDRTVTRAGANGTVTSDDGELRVLRQHGAGALIWQPWPTLRLSGRLDARLTNLDGHTNQARDLGTFEIVRGDSSRDSWTLDGRFEGRYGFLSSSALELEARGGLRRGDDDWNLRYLLADGATSAGARLRDLDRHLLSGMVELRLLTRLLSQLRATLGLHLEGLRSDEDLTQWVDAFQLGNRSRTRAGAFLSARSRFGRRLVLDGRGTVFRNTWTTSDGGKDEHWRYDVRLRATATVGPLMVFALGSLTEDRHDLSGGQSLPSFATLDFTGRSWVAVGGATATLGTAGWVTGTYTLVANTVDLTTRLQDAALSGNLLLPWRKLRLQVSVRYLDFRDRAPILVDGIAVVLLATAAGGF
jgi:hypothetical protein